MWDRISRTTFFVCSFSILILLSGLLATPPALTAPVPNKRDYPLKEIDLYGIWKVSWSDGKTNTYWSHTGPKVMPWYWGFEVNEFWEQDGNTMTWGEVLQVYPTKFVIFEKQYNPEYSDKYVYNWHVDVTEFDKVRKEMSIVLNIQRQDNLSLSFSPNYVTRNLKLKKEQ